MTPLTMVATCDHLGVGSVSTPGDAGVQEGGRAVPHLGLGSVSCGVWRRREGEGFTSVASAMNLAVVPSLTHFSAKSCCLEASALARRLHPPSAFRQARTPVPCWAPAPAAPGGVRAGAGDLGAHHSPVPQWKQVLLGCTLGLN